MTAPGTTGGGPEDARPAAGRVAGAARVLVMTAGGRGDVAPYTGLAAGLRDAGHDVAIATHGAFEGVVRSAGIEYRHLPENPLGFGIPGEERPSYGVKEGWQAVEGTIQEIAEAMLAAAREGADILVLNGAVAPLGWVIAEGLGLPCVGAFVAPAAPTAEFAPIYIPRTLGTWGNRAAWAAVDGMADAFLATRPVRWLCRELGLPRLSPRVLRRRQATDAWPIHCGYSPLLVPRPADWRPGIEVVGWWWPPAPAGWEPPEDLLAFLDDGPPPAYVGFGTLATDGERLADIVPRALRQAGVRGVLQGPWAAEAAEGDDMVAVGEVPHDWLFGRLAAVVHAAGAGVAGAGLRAGVPAVPVPMDLDQPFWALRLSAIGVASEPVPAKELTTEALAAGVRAVTTEPSYRDRAQAVAAGMVGEDGTAATVELVGRRLGARAPGASPTLT